MSPPHGASGLQWHRVPIRWLMPFVVALICLGRAGILSVHGAELTSTNFRVTTHTLHSGSAPVDATNASIESTSYRLMCTVPVAVSSGDRELTSTNFNTSVGYRYTLWGLGTSYDIWIGAADAGLETDGNWSNAFNWGYGVPGASSVVIIQEAREYPALDADGTCDTLLIRRYYSAGTATPSLTVDTDSVVLSVGSGGATIYDSGALFMGPSGEGTIDCEGDFTIQSTAGASSLDRGEIEVGGDVDITGDGTVVGAAAHDFTLDGSASTTIRVQGTGTTLGTLNIIKTTGSGAVVQTAGTVTTRRLDIEEETFEILAHTVNCTDTGVIACQIFPGGRFQMITAGGVLDVNGHFKLGHSNADAAGSAQVNITDGIIYVQGDFRVPIPHTFDSSGVGSQNVVVLDGVASEDQTVDCGGNLIFNDLWLKGHWTNNGTFTPGTGLVKFNGVVNQMINNAETFYNLQISNSGGDVFVTSRYNITVSNNLTLDAGSMFITSGPLTTLSVTGTVTVDGILTVPFGNLIAGGIVETGTINYVHNANTQITGNVQGFPVPARNLRPPYDYYAVYLNVRDVNGTGTEDRLYVLDQDGEIVSYYSIPDTDGDMVDVPRFYTETDVDNLVTYDGTDNYVHTVYMGTTTGKLYKFYLDDSSNLVLYPTSSGGWSPASNPISVGNEVTSRVYMYSDSSWFYLGAVDAAAQTVILKYNLDGSAPADSSCQTLRVESSFSSASTQTGLRMYCGSLSDGLSAYIYKITANPMPSTPEASYNTGRNSDIVASMLAVTIASQDIIAHVFVGDLGGYLMGLDCATNTITQLWADQLLDGPIYAGVFPVIIPLSEPMRLYVCTDNGTVYVRDSTTGANYDPNSPFQPGGSVSIRAHPLVRNGYIFVGNEDGKMFALDQTLFENGLDDTSGFVVGDCDFGAGVAIRFIGYNPTSSCVMVGTSQGVLYYADAASGDPPGW